MRLRPVLLFAIAGCITWGALHAQKPFRDYPTAEQHAEYSLPPDYQEITEWTRGRLIYPSLMAPHGVPDGYHRWTIDYPRSDRLLLQGIRRLTRINTRSVEQSVPLDGTDEIYNWPAMYSVEVGYWNLTDEMCAQLREYLLRGGFLVVDDFWGDEAWEVFRQTMERVLPDHEISDISESDSVMHVLYDIREKDRTFIPGTRHLRRGAGGQIIVQQPEGSTPAWLAMYDDKRRMVVAVNFNTDVGDAWEYADAPEYPEAMTALAYRYGLNYIIYSMTH